MSIHTNVNNISKYMNNKFMDELKNTKHLSNSIVSCGNKHTLILKDMQIVLQVLSLSPRSLSSIYLTMYLTVIAIPTMIVTVSGMNYLFCTTHFVAFVCSLKNLAELRCISAVGIGFFTYASDGYILMISVLDFNIHDVYSSNVQRHEL